MKRDDWILLTLTFLTGVAIGMYIYIAVFKPMYAPETLSGTESEASEWSVVSRKRDGVSVAGYSEPTFRLLGDGSYTYLPSSTDETLMEPKEGKLSRSILRELRTYDDTLMDYSFTVSRQDCSSERGGYDYEYRFTKNTLSYNLDTCYTSLGYDTPLSKLLEDVWDEIEGKDVNAGPGTFSDWAEGWIHDNFSVDSENPTY